MKKEFIKKRPYQICTCCVMDTSYPDITFDENGVCHRCNEYKNRILPDWNYGKGHEDELSKLINLKWLNLNNNKLQKIIISDDKKQISAESVS